MKNMKLNLIDEALLLYNITNIQLSSNTIKSTAFDVRFDDKSQAILLSLDQINFKISFNYSAFILPPIFADEGSIDISLDNFQLTIGLKCTSQNGRLKLYIVQFQPTLSKNDITLKNECYSDLTRYIFDEISFYKDLIAAQILEAIESYAQGNLHQVYILDIFQQMIDNAIDQLPNSFDIFMTRLDETKLNQGIITQQQYPIKVYTYLLNGTQIKLQYLSLPFRIGFVNQSANNSTNQKQEIQSFRNNRFDVQLYLSMMTFSSIIEKAYQSDLLRFYITSKPENLRPVFNLFLKQLDTEFINLLFPELYKTSQSGFTNATNPCMLRLGPNELPKIQMRESYFTAASRMKLDIYCVKSNVSFPNFTTYANGSNNLPANMSFVPVISIYANYTTDITELIRVSLINQLQAGIDLRGQNTNNEFVIKFSEITFKPDYIQVLVNPDIYSISLASIYQSMFDNDQMFVLDLILQIILQKLKVGSNSELKQVLDLAQQPRLQSGINIDYQNVLLNYIQELSVSEEQIEQLSKIINRRQNSNFLIEGGTETEQQNDQTYKAYQEYL
ncbi:UNKNOWN [Stylonychia lemnae]|uniref:Uncharacterized protein n=1 Tax=Stylonychia lemnae TaxID=5949 RepID=A0A078AX18_STYLE|nr:UNKNOWN [Stylonychia lemnae]|eukprot:CDW85338.1 UNKNOWN [Stylonychia lemnae]